jgi:phosphotransferase system enzyme I (PtsI)
VELQKLLGFIHRIYVASLVFVLISGVSLSSASEKYIPPKSIFSEAFEGEIDTLRFLTEVISFFKGEKTAEQFQEDIKQLGLNDLLYRFETVVKDPAVRFRSRDGKWYRLGKSALGKSDPELGFLISKKTEEIEAFVLESFERSVNVDILVPGIAFGTVVKVEGIVNFLEHQPAAKSGVDVDKERDVLFHIEGQVAASFSADIENATGEQAGILEAESVMMPELVEDMRSRLSFAVDAREALLQVISERAQMFNGMPDPKFRSLATDMMNIGQRLIDALDGVNRIELLDEKIGRLAKNGQKAILVGKILPSHFTLKNRAAISGIVTDHEQLGGHNSILAKGAGIAFAKNSNQIASVENELQDGDTVALELILSDRNGQATVTLNPEPGHRNRILRKTEELLKYREAVGKLKSSTRDGHSLPLHLNVAVHDDFPWQKGEFPHVGLVRSDFTYLQTEEEPTQDDLVKEYSAFFGRAIAAGVNQMNFRTFDLDLGDKSPGYFMNPDKREGIDFSLNDAQGAKAFEAQVKAIFIALASQMDERPNMELDLLFPKVRSIGEYHRAAEIVNRILDQLRSENAAYGRIRLKLGIMLETKEALDKVESFIGEVDFINVGTNDLTLSLFSDKVSRTPKEGKVPITEYSHRVLGAIEKIVKAAQAHPNVQRRPPICVCGDLASHAEYGLFLLGLGYSGLSLSMPYDQVLDLKVNIAAHDFDELKQYASKVSERVQRAQKAAGAEAERTYGELKEFLREQRSEMEEATLEYLTYEWANSTLSLDKLIQILGRIMDTIERASDKADIDMSEESRRELGLVLLDNNILTPGLYIKFLKKKWDLNETLGILEVWAYRQLINQGTFYVYRAKKIGNDYWIRVLPTGEEFHWRSRYDRRIVRQEGRVFIKAGPDLLIPAVKISGDADLNNEIYEYEDHGQTFHARSIVDRGTEYTYVKAGPEKNYVIGLFKRGKSEHPQYEKLYKDKKGRVQIVHSADWMRHPVFSKMPYDTSKLNHSVLNFLLSDDALGGEITWGQNMARPGYGHLFEDKARILSLLIEQLQLLDMTIDHGRKHILERLELLTRLGLILKDKLALENRVKELEALLRKIGVREEVIADPSGFDAVDQAA